MKYFQIKFRTRIALILVAIIGLTSSVAFYLFNINLSNKIYESKESLVVSVLTILKDEMNFTVNIHGGNILKEMLSAIDENNNVMNAFLTDEAGTVKFPKKYNHIRSDSSLLQSKSIPFDKITMKRYNDHVLPFSRVFIPINNEKSCVKCHSPDKKNLGFMIIDISNKSTEKNISFTRKFSIGFTLTLVLIIFCFVILFHYKFVRKSLSKFTESIKKINDGNLNERLALHESDELGKLGSSFNEMIDKFQKAQIQIEEMHNKQLESSKKMATIGEMSARLAHEIRNPMTGISNAIEIILQETNNDQHKPILEEIQRQTQRVNNAVSDLLKFSKTKDVTLIKYDIVSKIQNIIFFLESQALYDNIDLTLDHSEAEPFFFDPELMENVILNLAMNAARAMNNQGKITFKVTAAENNKFINIQVSDTGTGIPEENIQYVFKPFFTTHTEGTGLGLAIANEIITKHGGEIWVKNNIEKGCTFYINLPYKKDLINEEV